MLTPIEPDCNTASETPDSNTGSPRQGSRGHAITAHIDYLVICGAGYIDDAVRAIYACFGNHFNWEDAKPVHRGQRYSIGVVCPLGIEIAYTPDEIDDTFGDVRVSIPGAASSSVPNERLWQLAKFFSNRFYHCTRLDIAIDDYNRDLPLDAIALAGEAGDYSGASECRWFRRKRRGEYGVGQTIYFGSSQSDKQIRIYDKAMESNGSIDSVRYEVQWRAQMAQKAFEAYTDAASSANGLQATAGLAIGAMVFVRRTSTVLSRCPLYDWWQKFIDAVGEPLKMRIPSIQAMISTKISWIENQVSGTLALISQCKGLKWMEDWLHTTVQKRLVEPSPSRAAFVKTWNDRQTIDRMPFARALEGIQLELFPKNTPTYRDKIWLAPLHTEHTPPTTAPCIQSKSMSPMQMELFPAESVPCAQSELLTHPHFQRAPLSGTRLPRA
jgi:hypothetical protein